MRSNHANSLSNNPFDTQQHQNENNKKMRNFYHERNQEEIRLRQMKNTENKEKSKA